MDNWTPIDDFPRYEVSEQGYVRNAKTKRVLKPRIYGQYERVTLYNECGPLDRSVHKVVAETFCPGYNDGLEVNHIDGNKRNNAYTNLEWCSRSENIRHAFRTGLKELSGPHEIRPVRIVETNEVFSSVRECARAIDGDIRHIHKCLDGCRNTHKKYHFEYV